MTNDEKIRIITDVQSLLFVLAGVAFAMSKNTKAFHVGLHLITIGLVLFFVRK